MSRKPRLQLVAALDDTSLGLEARADDDDHMAVRVWLRLLACCTQIEQEIRTRLRQNFGSTLPRFDYLAQLERHPQGLRMNALSRYLMVTGGNVTGLTDQLVADGLVERAPDPLDRRSILVRLTAGGRTEFARMAGQHELWLTQLFDGFAAPDKDQLYQLLGALRLHLARQAAADQEQAAALRPARPRKPSGMTQPAAITQPADGSHPAASAKAARRPKPARPRHPKETTDDHR